MIENLFYIIVALLFSLVIVFRDKIKRIIFSPTGGFEVELHEEEDEKKQDKKPPPPDVEPESEKQEKPSVSPFLTGEIDFDEQTDLEPEFMSDDYLVMLSSRLDVYAKPGDSVKFIDKTSRPSEEEDDELKLSNSDE